MCCLSARPSRARSLRAESTGSSTTRPYGNGFVKSAAKQPDARRVTLARKPFPLYYNSLVPTKVYLWVYKVPTFLYKTLRIALETQVDGVCST